MHDYDAAVIGSGIGGLACALALARTGQRVVVFERELAGGWCHSFQRKGFRFTPGLHYVGELQEDGLLRRALEGLGVAEDLLFFEQNTDAHDHLKIGDFRFSIPRGVDRFEERLVQVFPKEQTGIKGYLKTLKTVCSHMRDSLLTGPESQPGLAMLGTRFWMASLSDVLDSHISDPLLKAVLTGRCGNHGLGPDKVPAFVHMAVEGHYLEGGWYPRGGGSALVQAFVQAIESHGGEVRERTPVQEVLLEHRSRGPRAIGVRLNDGTEVRASQVISNADPHGTFHRLMSLDSLSSTLRRRLEDTTYSASSMSLFCVVDGDLRDLGMDSGNLWALPSVRKRPLEGLFMGSPSLKDPTMQRGNQHALEAVGFVQWEHFSKPGGDYNRPKEALLEAQLQQVEQALPGFREHVTWADLGTPKTNQKFIGTTDGCVYGTEKIRKQSGAWAFSNETEVESLYLCGASTNLHGVMASLYSGLWAAAAILRCRPVDFLTENQHLETAAAEGPHGS